MKSRWLGWKYALLVIGLVVLTLLVMDFNNRMAALRRLTGEKEAVGAKVTGLVQTQMSLETQIAFATSDEAVEQWAYVEGHWVRQGEVLVVPLPEEGEPPTPVPTPMPTLQPESNWKIWLSLFVDPAASAPAP